MWHGNVPAAFNLVTARCSVAIQGDTCDSHDFLSPLLKIASLQHRNAVHSVFLAWGEWEQRMRLTMPFINGNHKLCFWLVSLAEWRKRV